MNEALVCGDSFEGLKQANIQKMAVRWRNFLAEASESAVEDRRALRGVVKNVIMLSISCSISGENVVVIGIPILRLGPCCLFHGLGPSIS